MRNMMFVIFAFLFASVAQAKTSGALFINTTNTLARLVINESMEDGDLSRFFDQMKVQETVESSKKTKSFKLSNARFSLVCNKGISTDTPPSTSCTYAIKAGDNTADVNTFISKMAEQKVATIGMTQVFSKEFEGIFPAVSDGSIAYLLKLSDGIVLEANGTTSGNLTIGFRAK